MMNVDWQINIENVYGRVAQKYGSEVANSVFRRYNATCFEDLSSAYYSEVFGDLMQIDEDE